MIKIKDKKDCCGCNACGDVCPHGAITFIADNGGFLYPNIDYSRCKKCGLCENVCPQLKVEMLRRDNNFGDPKSFAAFANDISIRFDSTSGGIFSVLANRIFENGGFVGGAVWDESFLIHQVVTNNRDDIDRLRSSKYAQSDSRGFYLAVRKACETGRPVLVCGLPCQMTAVRSFLGRDYPNLIIVDLICRSVSSPAFLQQYIAMQEDNHKSRVVAIKQKDKGLGWRNLTTKLTFANGDIEYDPKRESYFMRAFEADMISRPSCYDCKFKGFPRLADITLADCWGAVDKLPEYMDCNIGTSLIMCNTGKGEDFVAEILKTSEVTSLAVNNADVIKGNPGLVRSIGLSPVNSEIIFNQFGEKRLDKIMDPLLIIPQRKVSLLRRLYRRIRRLLSLRKHIVECVRINGWERVLCGRPLVIPRGRVLFAMDPGSELIVNEDTSMGCSFVPKSNIESRVRFWPGAKLELNGGTLGVGSYMLLFKNSKLTIGSGCCINVGFSVTCGKSIYIGKNVFIGQNVSIRDTHGDHYINTPGYQATKPVEIGDHVWIASGATIMPGVKIGPGSIVAARALVTKDVPPCTLVAGVPARVIRENVQFRC